MSEPVRGFGRDEVPPKNIGAEEGIRTPTVLLPPAPQAAANWRHTRSDQHSSAGSGADQIRLARSVRLYLHRFAHDSLVCVGLECGTPRIAPRLVRLIEEGPDVRRPSIVRACSSASRRVASLRPRTARLTALTPTPRAPGGAAVVGRRQPSRRSLAEDRSSRSHTTDRSPRRPPASRA
jgi:hypothetical protein